MAEDTRLLHEAAWALVACFSWLRQAENGSLRQPGMLDSATQLFFMCFNSRDPVLREVAAETAVTLAAEEAGGAGGGDDSRLGQCRHRVLRCLLLALADDLLAVRVATKRAIRSVGLSVLGWQPDVAALFASSALDERWKTDLASFFFEFLRLLELHQPEELPAYLELVTQSVPTLVLWSQICIVCAVAGAILRIRSSRSAVSQATTALVKLLQHPDSRVKCAAAEALVFFRVAPEPQHEHADTGALPHAAAAGSADATQLCGPPAGAIRSLPEAQDESIAVRLLERGKQAVDVQAYADAVAEFSQGLECECSDDTRGKLLSSRAASYAYLNRHHEALADACQCQQLRPGWARSFECKGAALLGLGRSDEALEAFKNALQLDPAAEDIAQCVENLEARLRAEAAPGARELMVQWLREEEQEEKQEEEVQEEEVQEEEVQEEEVQESHEEQEIWEGISRDDQDVDRPQSSELEREKLMEPASAQQPSSPQSAAAAAAAEAAATAATAAAAAVAVGNRSLSVSCTAGEDYFNEEEGVDVEEAAEDGEGVQTSWNAPGCFRGSSTRDDAVSSPNGMKVSICHRQSEAIAPRALLVPLRQQLVSMKFCADLSLLFPVSAVFPGSNALAFLCLALSFPPL
jgi:predicted negative regulator of RcsB-dependent stress response